eukprot:SAG31_NODE_27698_length_421_cov_1.391304_1_plen_25_part_10
MYTAVQLYAAAVPEVVLQHLLHARF